MKQTDGRAITNPENAQSFTHAEIKQAADEMNPDGLAGAFDAWSKIATAVTDAGHQFETAIKQAIEQHWEGAAADSAVRGIREYATQVGEFGETLHAQSTPLSQAASAASKFKLSVPDVVDTSTNPRGAELRNSSEEQARDEMTRQYIQPYGTTAPAIPTLPPPINPISVPPVGDLGTGTGTNPSPGKTTDQTGSGTEDSSKQAPTEKTDKAGQADKGSDASTPEAAETTEQTAPQSVSQDQNTNPSTTPAATTPAATSKTPTTSPLSASPITTTIPTTALPSTPATVTSASFNGTPSNSHAPISTGDHPTNSTAPHTSSAPNSEARQGTSRPPLPTTTPGAAGPQPAVAPARTGAPGTAGYPGMFPHGVRGRGEDDGEHKSPGFLRTEEHAKELLGEVEKTVPPVLGEK
ncbi:hypothetical protein DFR70_102418 [Nocardia tenerifensis]|uniref:PPE family protein n=1 Tax=Nocardia tenerifensis TaxID=228006 RepID=A0A318K742_9NOCA|nr:hypothetical protein [Nocardia tenerifensis]PXX68733.1 hypothetical protein DFR70_102418 [Nocardia tenerifensis]